MVTIVIEISAGESIENAFKEGIRISKILTCTILFKFNDVTCFCKPDGNFEHGVEAYNEAIKSKMQYKYAHS